MLFVSVFAHFHYLMFHFFRVYDKGLGYSLCCSTSTPTLSTTVIIWKKARVIVGLFLYTFILQTVNLFIIIVYIILFTLLPYNQHIILMCSACKTIFPSPRTAIVTAADRNISLSKFKYSKEMPGSAPQNLATYVWFRCGGAGLHHNSHHQASNWIEGCITASRQTLLVITKFKNIAAPRLPVAGPISSLLFWCIDEAQSSHYQARHVGTPRKVRHLTRNSWLRKGGSRTWSLARAVDMEAAQTKQRRNKHHRWTRHRVNMGRTQVPLVDWASSRYIRLGLHMAIGQEIVTPFQ